MIMNTNGTNPGMNVEDYEDMAVQKSNVAKRVAAGAAVFAGGAAVAGGAAYAATQTGEDAIDETLTTDDLVGGAEGAEEYKPQVQETHTTEKVIVRDPVKPEVPEEHKEPEMTWDETTNVYVDGEKAMSVEEGTYQGHKFALYDVDGDDKADLFAIDVNSNGQFEDNEVAILSPEDNVRMGHDTAQTTNHMYHGYEEPTPEPLYSQQEENIYNNFEDEKTGESYKGDYAENNPDYNPKAETEDYNQANVYLAENEKYDEGDKSVEVYEPEDNYLAEAEGYDNGSLDGNVDDPSGDLAEADEAEGYDNMMGGEEFIG